MHCTKILELFRALNSLEEYKTLGARQTLFNADDERQWLFILLIPIIRNILKQDAMCACCILSFSR